ncbi:HAMP domain-containing protein [Roseomonas sp. KE2513]|nr:HAMP domain-containing protein [Roseomonas sp. KE2513]
MEQGRLPSMTRRATHGSIRTRLHLCTLVAALGLMGLAAYEVASRTAELEENRIAMLHAVVDTAVASAGRFEAEERAGRLDRAAAQAAAAAAIRAMRYEGQEYLWINDTQVRTRVVMHPFRPDLEGQDVSEVRDPNGLPLFVAFAEKVRAAGAGTVGYLWPRPGADKPVEKLSYVAGFAPWGWVIGTGVYVDDLRAAQASVVLHGALVAGVSALLVVLMISLVGRSITRPLARIAAATTAMSGGDLGTPVGDTDRRDEFGHLARALETFREGGLRTRRLEDEARAERAVRDRRQVAIERQTQDFGASVSGVLASLARSADEMRGAASEMSGVVLRTREGAAGTAAEAEESSRNLSAVATATEELSASVSEIARQMARSTQSAQAAVQRAGETDSAVRGLSEAAAQIGEVLHLIADIAGQTNLLALNATIEAARAGEAGRGFAVVASEVKQLAAQTAEATGRIGEQVRGIQSATEEAVVAVRDVGAAIGEVEAIATAIAAAVEEQGAATREIAANVQTVAQATASATSSLRGVADVAEGAQGTSSTVLSAADNLAQVATDLRGEVDSFLRAMVAESEGTDRRRYERVPGGDVPLRLLALGLPGGETRVALRDIGQGGAAVACAWEALPGTSVELAAGAEERIPGRVVRADGACIAIAFRQDERSIGLVDVLLARLPKERQAA